MPRPIRLSTALLGLACAAGSLVAPDVRAQPPRPPAAQTQQQRPPQPPAGQPPAQGQPAQGQPGDAAQQQEPNARASGWVSRCISPGRKAPAECVLEQSLTLLRTGQVVAVVNLRFATEGQLPSLTVRVPHGVLLASGVRVRVDSGFALDLPIQTCEAQGCIATVPASNELLNAMRAGRQVGLLMKNTNNQEMGFGMPLEGFPAALDRVK